MSSCLLQRKVCKVICKLVRLSFKRQKTIQVLCDLGCQVLKVNKSSTQLFEWITVCTAELAEMSFSSEYSQEGTADVQPQQSLLVGGGLKLKLG